MNKSDGAIAMHGTPSVIVGIESCMDVHAQLTPDEINRLADATKSGLKKELLLAAKTLLAGEDKELGVGGKGLKTLIAEIKKSGIKTEEKLGGNAALEASQFLSLGAGVYFIGNFFSTEKSALASEIFFRKANFAFANESGKSPVSLILQHKNSRFILCNGEGRRINGLRKCISSLPKTIAGIAKKERISAICLPGWHVMFAEGISQKDADFVTGIVSKIRESKILMFTDTGSFGNLNDADVLRLWQIYGAFDIIGMNEFEFGRLCSVNGIPAGNAQNAIAGLLKRSRAHTIWVHTRDFQESASKKFGAGILKNAEDAAEAAGALHIENGGYPGAKQIFKLEKSGTRIKISSILNKIQTDKKLSFAEEPSFKAKKTMYEAGAGDISAAAYLWSIFME